MSRLVIGLTGPIGAGKTTVAARLGTAHGFARVRFAGPLKDMMRALGLTEAEIDGPLKEAPSPLLCGRSPRWAMQTLGSEWGRDLIHPDLWTTIWRQRASAFDRVVADDARFPNEAAAIAAEGGIIVRVERPGLAASPAETHQSEAHRLAAAATIVNDGSIEDLVAKVDALMTRLVSTAALGPHQTERTVA